MNYKDFNLFAHSQADGEMEVEVTESPVGRTRVPEVARFDPPALAEPLEALERGHISTEDLITLGEQLAAQLLPSAVREMFYASLERIGPERGLRLRLIPCAPEIAVLPWEYLYLNRAGGERELDGFLALDPRLSPVRDEPVPFTPQAAPARSPLKLLVGLASPIDREPLDLPREQDAIARALKSVPNITATYLEHLTADALAQAGQHFDLFHFAGHGALTAAGSCLLLERQDRRADPLNAERLALTLRALGVRVAVLSACESGARDRRRVWGGIAPALMKLGVGAAVAHQYPITDETAIVFAERFYRALAAGLGPDEAVSAGRLAILNATRGASADWGTPVLYVREPDGRLFPELADDAALEPERKAAAVAIQQRLDHLRGKLYGVRAGTIRAGTVEVHQVIREVNAQATATGVEAQAVKGGTVKVEQDIDTVDEGGTVTGVTLGEG